LIILRKKDGKVFILGEKVGVGELIKDGER